MRVQVSSESRVLGLETPTTGKRGGQFVHGMTKTPEWRAWVAARLRCTDNTHPDWPNYGGRGIRMCHAWKKSFLSFFRHIGLKPSRRYSLDRIDNNKGYKPGNVRWATRTEQNRNKRSIV